jgi:hypothetical protein
VLPAMTALTKTAMLSAFHTAGLCCPIRGWGECSKGFFGHVRPVERSESLAFWAGAVEAEAQEWSWVAATENPAPLSNGELGDAVRSV